MVEDRWAEIRDHRAGLAHGLVEQFAELFRQLVLFFSGEGSFQSVKTHSGRHQYLTDTIVQIRGGFSACFLPCQTQLRG